MKTTTTYGQPMTIPFSSAMNVFHRVEDRALKTFIGANLHRVIIMISLCVRDFVNTPPASMSTSEYVREYRSFIQDFIDHSFDLNLRSTDERFVQFSSVLGEECLGLMRDDVPSIFRGKIPPEKIFDRQAA